MFSVALVLQIAGPIAAISVPYPTYTTRLATSNTALPSKTYAAPYSSFADLFTSVSSTTWPNWTPLASQTAVDGKEPYGDVAYSRLWNDANPAGFSRGLYSTTVSPTPVPTGELVFPPPLYFAPQENYTIPKDFVFGIAGSASQNEGAIADHGKSPAITDLVGNVISLAGVQGVNDYTTNEHFYLYKQDIERFAAIGAKHYYFSIPWTRILPFAVPGSPVNTEAIEHYDDVINFALSKGIEPVVALTHFDTPLQFFGSTAGFYAALTQRQYYGLAAGLDFGYGNTSFVEAYVSYAKIVLAHYADRVPIWITFNEPQEGSPDGAAVDHVIKAHAQVVHYYRDTLKATGKVSMKMGLTPALPYDATNASDLAAAELYTDLYVNAYLYPLALGRDYPDAFKWAIQDYVPLAESDLEYLNNTLDFIAIDAYFAPVIQAATPDYEACAKNNATTNTLYRYPICLNSKSTTTTGWAYGDDPTSSITSVDFPTGIYPQLSYLWQTFGKPILVSEFGFQLPNVTVLIDNVYNSAQSLYLLSYLQEMLRALHDGIDVMGALVWNWGDDWEFFAYDTGFGLQYINHTTQERSYRRSFFDVIDYVESRRC